MVFTQFLTQTCSESNSSDHLHTELVQTKSIFWPTLYNAVSFYWLALLTGENYVLSKYLCLYV